MPAGFINLGFETGTGIPGFLAGWTVAITTTSVKYAAYDDISTGSTTPYETFEYSWGNSLSDLDEFDLDVDVVYALYDLVPTLWEDFESGWAGGNQVHYISIPATILAAYDAGAPEDAEDFEEEWSSNEDDVTEFAPGDTTLASYDTTAPEDREDFEEEWSSNEDDITDFVLGVDTSAAEYDSGGTPEFVEDFEETDLVLYRIEVQAVGADTDEYHVVVNGADVLYTATGVGPEGAIRNIIVTKINAQLAGIAVAAPDGVATMTIRSAQNGVNLTVETQVTGLAKLELTIPDRTAYWTQLGEM